MIECKSEEGKMEVIKVENKDLEEWDRFVSLKGTLLQSWQWGEIKAHFGWKPFYLVVREKKEWVVSALVLSYFLPFVKRSFFYIPEGPIIYPKDEEGLTQEALRMLLSRIKQLAQEERAIFLRVEPISFPVKLLVKSGFKKAFEDLQPKTRLWIDLTKSEKELFAQMKHKGRYNIKIAQKNGVNIQETTDLKMLDTFYRLYQESARRDRFSTRPKQYFQVLFQTLTKHNFASFFFAFWNQSPLAVALVTFFGQFASYLYGGTSNRLRNLMASYLLHWEVIKRAKKRSCRIYDLGAISPTHEPTHPWSGLREFKEKFGGEEIQLLGAYDLVYRPFSYNLLEIIEKIRREKR